MKTIKIEITAEYEHDLSSDDLKEIERIVTDIWPEARSLHTDSNTCKTFETEINFVRG